MPKHSSKKSTLQKSQPKPSLYKSKASQYPVYTSVYVPKELPSRSNPPPPPLQKPLPPMTRDEYRSPLPHRHQDKTTEVLISDFRFIPSSVRINVGSIVEWRIEKNETKHRSGLYGSETRSFVIVISSDSDQHESDLLSKDQTFCYMFDKAGTYQIKCSNYPQIQGLVEVCEAKGDDFETGLLGQVGQVTSSVGYKEEERSSLMIVENKSPEVKSPLLLLKDFEEKEIQELILELSLQSKSSSKKRENSQEKGNRGKEREGNEVARYSIAKDQLVRGTEGNIFDELISREFNGLVKPRENGLETQKNEKIAKKAEESSFNKICTEIMRQEVSAKSDSEERSEELRCIRNPKDEEQKFDMAMNHSQECIAQEEEVEEIEEDTNNADRFLMFIKEGLKESKEKFKKKNSRRNSRTRKSNKGIDEEEMEKIEALKNFLTSRFEFAVEFDS